MSATPPSTSGLADRLALILAGLRGVVAARGRDRALAPLLALLWSRLHRAAHRFARLVAAPRPPAPRVAASRPSGSPDRLPRGVAWLLRLVPEAAPYGTQLQALLAEPAMAELLAATPRAARILRPLCRMLAVLPDTLPDLPKPALAGRSSVRSPIVSGGPRWLGSMHDAPGSTLNPLSFSLA